MGGAAAVADVQRPGRIGGNEFHQHLLAAAQLRTAIGRAGRQHLADHAGLGGRRQGEIDEAGTGHLGVRHVRRFRQFGQQVPGDVARVLLQAARQLQGDVAGKIAMRGLAGAFEENRRVDRCGRDACQGAPQQVGQFGFGIDGHRKRLEAPGKAKAAIITAENLPIIAALP
jgi:hypothetical protein